jgi:hypothetical protein
MEVDLIKDWSAILAMAGIIGTYAINSYRVNQLEKQLVRVENKSSQRRTELEKSLDQIKEAQHNRDKEVLEIKYLIKEVKLSVDSIVLNQTRETQSLENQIADLKKN